jgi:hypothetical protein
MLRKRNDDLERHIKKLDAEADEQRRFLAKYPPNTDSYRDKQVLEIKGLRKDISGLNDQIFKLTRDVKTLNEYKDRNPPASSICHDKVVLVNRIEILENIVIPRLREQLKEHGGDEGIEVDQVVEGDSSTTVPSGALPTDWAEKAIGVWDEYSGTKAEGNARRAEMRDKYGLKSKWTA